MGSGPDGVAALWEAAIGPLPARRRAVFEGMGGGNTLSVAAHERDIALNHGGAAIA